MTKAKTSQPSDKKERPDKVPKLLSVLKANSGKTVSLQILVKKSEYSESTLRTYLGKNKLMPYASLESGDKCKINDVDSLTEKDLRRVLSQRENRYMFEHLGVSELVSNLLERSRTNAGLALELFNRPELDNRLDAFLLLFVTAWEQLLKAEIEQAEKGSIFTGRRTSFGRPETIGLSKAINKMFQDQTDPVRRNLEQLKNLRDGATHLLVPEITGIASRYFQSGLLNYIDRFSAFAKEQPFRFTGTGLLTLGVPYETPTIETLTVAHGKSADDILRLILSLEDDAVDEDRRFAIPTKHELVLNKKGGNGAISLTINDEGTPAKIIKVAGDVNRTHPYRTTECREILSERLTFSLSLHDVSMIASYLKIKDTNNKYHHGLDNGASTIHKYSDAFIELVVDRWNSDALIFQKAHEAGRKKKGDQ